MLLVELEIDEWLVVRPNGSIAAAAQLDRRKDDGRVLGHVLRLLDWELRAPG
jgi:hypothetical protein